MAGANVYLNRISITSINGWVKLANSRMICDAQIQPLSSTFSIRWNGGTSITLNANTVYYFKRVDLSELEVSTTSGTAVVCLVIGQAPGGDSWP